MDTQRSGTLIDGRLRILCPYGLRLASGILGLGLFPGQAAFFYFQLLFNRPYFGHEVDKGRFVLLQGYR